MGLFSWLFGSDDDSVRSMQEGIDRLKGLSLKKDIPEIGLILHRMWKLENDSVESPSGWVLGVDRFGNLKTIHIPDDTESLGMKEYRLDKNNKNPVVMSIRVNMEKIRKHGPTPRSYDAFCASLGESRDKCD